MGEGVVTESVTPRQRTGRERSLANLKPYKPGETGNRAGINQYTKQRERFQEHIAKYLEQNSEKVDAHLSRGEALALAVLEDALAGDATSRKEALARLWPIIQKADVNLGGQQDNPIAVARPNYLDNLDEEDKETLRKLAMKAICKGSRQKEK